LTGSVYLVRGKGESGSLSEFPETICGYMLTRGDVSFNLPIGVLGDVISSNYFSIYLLCCWSWIRNYDTFFKDSLFVGVDELFDMIFSC